MAKEANFGGFPTDELEILLKFWGTEPQGGLSDGAYIAKLVDKVTVLEALVKEEHAAANAGENIDLVSIVMKSIDVRVAHQNAIGGAGAGPLAAAIDDLAKQWGK